jgi:hypothetical protein
MNEKLLYALLGIVIALLLYQVMLRFTRTASQET